MKQTRFIMLKPMMILALGFAFWATASLGFETRAKSAYVIDQSTGTVMLSKNADVPLPPASMSKLMTLYMAFEAIRDGRLRWDERLRVSRHAMNYGGSTMFLDTTDRVTVEDLVRGIIVLSGNDACAVLAEALSFDGSEAGFAEMMTNRARELGMTNSTFANSNGWPHPRQRMSMEDLAILADRLIADFPAYYALFAEREFKFDGRAPSNTQNRNPLLSLGIGADGLKTGHTQEAGYGLVGSAKQGERRIIFVISGLDSANARANEAERLVSWAFRQFEVKTLLEPDAELGRAQVWMGQDKSVGLALSEPVHVLVPVAAQEEIQAKIVYDGPLEAPVPVNAVVGKLELTIPGLPARIYPLRTTSAVERGGFTPKVAVALEYLLGKLDQPINPVAEGS